MTFTIDLKNRQDLIRYFRDPQDCKYEITEKGLVLTATWDSRDPYVFCDFMSMIGLNTGFKDSSDLQAIVARVSSNHPGYFEIYYANETVPEPAPYCNAGDDYEGGNQWETMVCKFLGRPGYEGKLQDGFRFDWSNYVNPGDSIIIESLTLYADAAEARSFADKENENVREYRPNFEEEAAADKAMDVPGYYVCLYDNKLPYMETGNILERFDNLEDAKKLCDEKKVYGYRVADENGKVVYTPYTLLQCDILREGKYVTDFVRTNGFLYGDAPINPGMNCEAKRVSCDRLVCWVLYRLGFTKQPYVQGVVVSAFPAWCEENDFKRIENYEALEPGDVMLVRPHSKGYPQHAFLFAGYSEKPDVDPNFPAQVADPNAPAGPELPPMYSYRYDCGSDKRIQSVQPSQETLFPGAYIPVCVFRPVAKKENCVNYFRYQ